MSRLLDDIEDGVLLLHRVLGKLRSRIGTVMVVKKENFDEKIRTKRIAKIIRNDIEMVEAMLQERLKSSKKSTRSRQQQLDDSEPSQGTKSIISSRYQLPPRYTSPSPTRRIPSQQPIWCSAVNGSRKVASIPVKSKAKTTTHPAPQQKATQSCIVPAATLSKSCQIEIVATDVAVQTDQQQKEVIRVKRPSLIGFQRLSLDCLFIIIDFLHIEFNYIDLLCLSRSVSITSSRVLRSKKHLLVDNKCTYNIVQEGFLNRQLRSVLLHVDSSTVGIAERFIREKPESLLFLQLIPKGIHAGELPEMGLSKLTQLRWLDTQIDVMESRYSMFYNFPHLEGCFVRRFSRPINLLKIPDSHPIKALIYGFNNPLSNSDCDVKLPKQIEALGIFESADILPVSDTLRIAACRLHATVDLLSLLPETCPNLRFVLVLSPSNPKGSTKHLLDTICSQPDGLLHNITIIRTTESNLLQLVRRLVEGYKPIG